MNYLKNLLRLVPNIRFMSTSAEQLPRITQVLTPVHNKCNTECHKISCVFPMTIINPDLTALTDFNESNKSVYDMLTLLSNCDDHQHSFYYCSDHDNCCNKHKLTDLYKKIKADPTKYIDHKFVVIHIDQYLNFRIVDLKH